MWERLKEAAEAMFGRQGVTFEETPSSLVGETLPAKGFCDPSLFQFFDAMQDNMPNGCVVSIYNLHPKVVFIAATNRTVIAEVEQRRGYRKAA
jgi:hypothetical protein